MNTKTNLYNLNPKMLIVAAAMLTPVIALAAINATPPSESPNMTRSATVALADLDLTTPAGINAARDRVHKTARHLCSSLSDSSDLSHAANFVICVDEAVARAMQKVVESGSNVLARSLDGQRNAR
ncbi:MAG: UrcA family protein [Gammaproteobacteria bacterium]